MSIVNGAGSAAKTRGLICLLVGWVVLFIMDSDSAIANHSESHKHQSGLNHVFYHVVGWFGLSDHSGGVFLLSLAVFLRMICESNFRKQFVGQ
uniref:Uncharacterized protein n=1 Tax=Globodera rostochiensis TaxID=31243 RepID=A0A914HTQ9_GLORO